jgi:hypothetical protein
MHLSNSNDFSQSPHRDTTPTRRELHGAPLGRLPLDSGNLPNPLMSRSRRQEAVESVLPAESPSATSDPPSLPSLESVQSIAPAPNLDYFSASDIARVLGLSKRAIHYRATRENWPVRQVNNRLEYAPPAGLIIVPSPSEAMMQTEAESVTTFAEAGPDARALALRRKAAIDHYREILATGCGIECALAMTSVHCGTLPEAHVFSTRALRRWIKDYEASGLDGLVDQKQGRVGRKSVASHLTEDLRNQAKALVEEKGSAARAVRILMRDPNLPATLRSHLHEGHASKSYVTPSIRRAIQPAPLTHALLQGPRAARLSGRWTPGNYDGVKAGAVFVSDDMTSNSIVWVEWPNAHGWRLGQPQVLPVLDVGSLRWLNVRVIMRDGGQYTADDIWGLFGDTFDIFGLPDQGFVLEGGHWQSNRVIGARTGLADDEREGGLASLGLSVYRSYDPRSKIIEGMFNQLQWELDAFCGYAGRDQRLQLPEHVKKQLALCKAGKAHPRQFFHHISELANHVQAACERLNHERQDGKVLKGRSPLEKWAEDAPRLREIPDHAKWLYRSDLSIVTVTSNGIRVTIGSGAKQLVYYYDNPEVLTPWQGPRVKVYWSSKKPDADACVMSITDPNHPKFLCLAKRVLELDRFGATPEQLDAEAARKKAAMHYARTEMRAIQPHLARRTMPVPVDQTTTRTGETIKEAIDRARTKASEKAALDKQIRQTEVTADDMAAATDTTDRRIYPAGSPSDPSSDLLEQFADLFAGPAESSEPAASIESILEP